MNTNDNIVFGIDANDTCSFVLHFCNCVCCDPCTRLLKKSETHVNKKCLKNKNKKRLYRNIVLLFESISFYLLLKYAVIKRIIIILRLHIC